MGGRTTNVGGGRRMTPKVVAGLGLAAIAMALFHPASFGALRRLTAPDIHSEYVKIVSGKDTITAYLAYPERPQPAPAVIVIHEIFGQSDVIRQTTEQLAKD